MKTGRTPVHSGKMKRPDSSPRPGSPPSFFIPGTPFPRMGSYAAKSISSLPEP